MFFLNKRSNFEKKPHELSYRSNMYMPPIRSDVIAYGICRSGMIKSGLFPAELIEQDWQNIMSYFICWDDFHDR